MASIIEDYTGIAVRLTPDGKMDDTAAHVSVKLDPPLDLCESAYLRAHDILSSLVFDKLGKVPHSNTWIMCPWSHRDVAKSIWTKYACVIQFMPDGFLQTRFSWAMTVSFTGVVLPTCRYSVLSIMPD